MHSQADVAYIDFKVQSQLTISKGATKPTNTNNQAAFTKLYEKRIWNKPSARSIEIRMSTSPNAFVLTPLEISSSPSYSHPAASHTRSDFRSLSSTFPSFAAFAYEICYDPCHSLFSCTVLLRDTLATLTAIPEGNMKEKTTAFDTDAQLVLVHPFPKADASITNDSSHHPPVKTLEFRNWQRMPRLMQNTEN